MKSFAIVVNIGGRSKRVKESAGKVAYAAGQVYGLTEYVGRKGSSKTTGCRVWIYSRQSKREMADTFFHEMTHVFLRMLGGVENQKGGEEALCRWIGYQAKLQLADYSPKYARNFKRRRVFG